VPDSVVDVRRPEFAFLAQDAKGDMTARIKARRLRGVVSYGLLVPAPAEAELGEDWAPRLGVTRYEPPEPGEGGGGSKFLIGGEEESPPDCPTGPNKYDVEAFERYHDVFAEGEPVFLSEKLDGANARFVFWGGRFYVKTRNRWVKRTPDYSHVTVEYLVEKGMPEDKAAAIADGLADAAGQGQRLLAVALEAMPQLQEYLRNNPGTVVFGEVYGNTNRLKYGSRRREQVRRLRRLPLEPVPGRPGDARRAVRTLAFPVVPQFQRREDVRKAPRLSSSAISLLVRPREEAGRRPRPRSLARRHKSFGRASLLGPCKKDGSGGAGESC
jgi:RNA ligase (TIGR02306 family)